MITILVLIGLIGGFPAGPIMSLAARVLPPETRRSAWACSTLSSMPR